MKVIDIIGMKKKVLSGLFALAVLVATGYAVNQSMRSDADLSDLALANVEALAVRVNLYKINHSPFLLL